MLLFLKVESSGDSSPAVCFVLYRPHTESIHTKFQFLVVSCFVSPKWTRDIHSPLCEFKGLTRLKIELSKFFAAVITWGYNSQGGEWVTTCLPCCFLFSFGFTVDWIPVYLCTEVIWIQSLLRFCYLLLWLDSDTYIYVRWYEYGYCFGVVVCYCICSVMLFLLRKPECHQPGLSQNLLPLSPRTSLGLAGAMEIWVV